MTKRNLVVSLFLVLGLVVLTSSALATEWSVGYNVNASARAEGLAEETGQVTLSLVAGGAVNSGSSFSLNYSPASVVPGTVTVACTANAAFSPESPWGGSTCAGLAAPSISGTTVTIAFNAGESFTTGDGSEIIVTVRLNASGVGGGKEVICTVAAHPPGGTGPVFTIQSGTQQGEVMYVNPFPSLSFGFGSEENDKMDTAAGVLSCLGAKETAGYKDWFIVNVNENFIDALTTETYEWTSDAGSGAGAVTNGSDIAITFYNVPAGVGIALEDIVPCSDLDTTNPLQCNSATANGSLDLYPYAPYYGEGTSTVSTITFTFYVTSMDNTAVTGLMENVNFSFKFWSHGALPAGLGSMTANVAYADVANSPNPIPYFTGANELATNLPVVDFYDCVTNLLFPYVNAYKGPAGSGAFSNFGTGIAIANTTMDPFGLNAADPIVKGAAVAENGSCWVYLYPNDLTAYQTITSAVIPSGGTWVFDVGTADSKFIGKQGYAIAICDFENAYGYAEIYDNYGLGAPTATLAYLPWVIANPGLYHRSPAGAGLGAGAIANYPIDRFFEKLLLYGRGDPKKE